MMLLLLLCGVVVTISAATTPASNSQPVVVVIHGLGLGEWAMQRVANALTEADYRVVNLSYKSRKVPLEELVSTWLPDQLELHEISFGADDPPVHFVTQSMGGIMLRGWLDQQPVIPANLKRVVMFAPPNQGSSLVDRIGDWRLFKLFTGVNGRRLSTQADSYPNQLGPWPVGPELGIIAGNRPLNPLFAYWTGGPSDGKVRVAETKLSGMTDHIVMPYSHTWLQYSHQPIRQVITFLATGRFNHPPAAEAAEAATKH